MRPVLLDLQRLTKRFGGLVALSEVSLSVAQGEIVGLIGPTHWGGQDHDLDGQRIGRLAPEAIAARGVSQVPEGRRSFPHLVEGAPAASRRGGGVWAVAAEAVRRLGAAGAAGRLVGRSDGHPQPQQVL